MSSGSFPETDFAPALAPAPRFSIDDLSVQELATLVAGLSGQATLTPQQLQTLSLLQAQIGVGTPAAAHAAPTASHLTSPPSFDPLASVGSAEQHLQQLSLHAAPAPALAALGSQYGVLGAAAPALAAMSVAPAASSTVATGASAAAAAGPAGAPAVTVKPRRRQNVACEKCHHNKVKCDGMRPCMRCTRAGRGDQCRDREIARKGGRPAVAGAPGAASDSLFVAAPARTSSGASHASTSGFSPTAQPPRSAIGLSTPRPSAAAEPFSMSGPIAPLSLMPLYDSAPLGTGAAGAGGFASAASSTSVPMDTEAADLFAPM